jgi:glycosyltransferase involved in cell wall biosynthesis
MKILILVDTLNNWALHNRAKAIKKFMPQHEIEIRAALGQTDKFLYDHDEFDVIHFNFTWGIDSYIDFILANKHKCLLTVVNERSLLQGIGIHKDRYKAFLKMYQDIPHKTAVNRTMADFIGGVYIPNGIDEDLFDKCKMPVVGYAGTGMPNKNAHLIEQACKEIGIEFRVAGYRYKGSERKPDFSHEAMKEFYCGLDVFVHASATEGFSNTVIEALSCNCPVIMTREGAWKEFEGWVEFIDASVADIKRALRKYTGRALINQKFTWAKVMPQYGAQYEAIYANNKRVPASV